MASLELTGLILVSGMDVLMCYSVNSFLCAKISIPPESFREKGMTFTMSGMPFLLKRFSRTMLHEINRAFPSGPAGLERFLIWRKPEFQQDG